jgi:uncharacterized protein YqjF (DUF2071 family)
MRERRDLIGSRLSEYVVSPLRQLASLRETQHRPWPRSSFPWVMGQSWLDLLFVHWRLDPELLRAHVPRPLELDVYDGAAWLGITPFKVAGFRLVGLPPVPGLSTFAELNVRTYVTFGGKPGIWFLSLDAASRLAVEGGRRVYRLPYFFARMTLEPEDTAFAFHSQRIDSSGGPAAFAVRYRVEGEESTPSLGTLEAFLVERYCLYALGERGEVKRAEIHHPAWRLHPASADIGPNTMPPPKLELPSRNLFFITPPARTSSSGSQGQSQAN